MSVIISLVILIVLFLIVLYYLLRGKRFEPSVPKASVPPRPQETPQPLSELTTVQPRTPETPTQETPIPEAAPTEEKAKELVREEHPEQLTPVEAPAQAPEVGEEVAERVAEGAAEAAEAKEDVSEAGEVVEKAVEGAVTEVQEEAGEVAAAPAEAKAEAGPPRRDPLEKINGIGPVYKRRLYEAGIYTFQQLAELSPDQIRAIIQPKSWQKIEPESWIQQARELAASQDEAAS